MARDEARFSPDVGSLYSYVEVADWTVTPTHCTYRQWGGITSSYGWGFTGYCTLQWWENGTWRDASSEVSKYYSGYGDSEYDYIPSDSFVRQAADRTVSLGNYAHAYVNGVSTSARAWIDFTVPHLPNEPTDLSASYDGANTITLSWTSPTRSCDNLRIEVSTDGGSWSELPAISASATSYAYTSVTDDHSYRFRMRAYYKNAYSAYTSATTAIVTKPAAPQGITTAAAGGTNITVTLDNPSPVATKVQYEVSTDDGATWGATQDSASLTSFSVSASGTVKIRVRNYNATGTSAWLTSETVTTICPPNPPTLTAPTGNVLDLAAGSVTFEWVHNTLDGSAQSAAQIDYSTNGGSTWTSITSITTAQSYTMAIPWSAGTTVTWRARTKGADANYSNWSSTKAFNVYTAPTVSITSPTATVTGMPIQLTATYSDMAGFTCQAATVSLTKDGRTLYSEPATINGTAITAQLDTSEFLPANGESYTVVLDVRSSSSLQTTANATFTTAFTEPQAGELSITNDPDTGYASLLATFDNHASDVQYSGATNAQFDSTAGFVKSLTVEGQSAKWNQLAPNINTTNYAAYNNSSATFAASDGIGTMTIVSNAGNSYGCQFRQKNYDAHIKDNHIFYMAADANPSVKVTRFAIRITVPIGTDKVTAVTQTAPANTWTRFDGLCTSGGTSEGGAKFGFCIYDGDVANGSTIQFKNLTCVDLTAIFGSGNEPATVEAFKATDVYKAKLAAGELYDYDAGSLVSIESVSVGDGTITTTLRSAGTVHDQLQVGKTSWTVERKVGYIDLGTVTWNPNGSLSGGGAQFVTSALTDRASTANGICNLYPVASSPVVGQQYNMVGLRTNSNIVVFNHPTYTTSQAADFKTSMSGVILFYELATPTQDAETSMSTIEIGSAFTVGTELGSTFDMTAWDGSADAVSISVARVNADGITPLIEDGESGAGAVDKYAPLNTPYQYAVTTKSSANAVKTVYVDNEIVTDLWFAYWGDNIASAKWNPDNGGIAIARPQKTRVYYAGRKDPVSYDGAAVSLTETPSWMLVDRSEIQPFVQLIEDGGRGVYKSCDGWVYHADFDLTLTPKYIAIGYYGGIGLTVTRIAGEQL